MSNPFVVQNGQVYINQKYVHETTHEYPVLLSSDKYEWVIFKDGHVEIRDIEGTLRVKTFTTKSV